MPPPLEAASLEATTPELLTAPKNEAATERPAIAERLGDELFEREVCDFMTLGCVTISEDATVAQAAEPTPHAACTRMLVEGAANGTPLGWVTARGGCPAGSTVTAASPARATPITEQVTAIDPHQRLRVGLYALSLAGTTHSLVRRRPHLSPEGVLIDFDLAAAVRR
jgi:hypothetical protein